jgi:toxin-antitoxin system PIN domain toxin
MNGSTNSLNFLDTNVWLALVWGRHIHSAAARQWFESCTGEQFLFCRFTQIALLRLLTAVGVMGNDVQTMSGAWALYDQCSADERMGFLAEPGGLEPRFRGLASGRGVSPKLWADAYLAAFASSAGVRLVTFDKVLGRRAAGSLVLN